MGSVKVKFLYKKLLKDGTHPIAIQVIHNRKKKLFFLKHSLSVDEWDYMLNEPNKKASNYRLLRARIKSAVNELESILIKFETSGNDFTVEDIEKQYSPEKFENKNDIRFDSFVDNVIEELVKENRLGNAKAYSNMKTIFCRLMGDKILIKDITESIIRDFIHKMTVNHLKVNSRAVHLRELRATLNKAIKLGYYDEANYPFRKISVQTQKTRKRAVNRDIIKLLEELDLSDKKSLQFHKDIFLFSFYNRGMNFIDLAFLKVKNIESGRINYSRRKTGQHFSIKLTDKAMQIIQKYNDLKDPDSYLFPIITRHGKEYLDYKNAMRLTNKKLKKISQLLKLDVNLSSYVARHSWATIAKKAGVSTAIISEGLGHTTEEITQVYLDSFENDTLDAANELVIS